MAQFDPRKRTSKHLLQRLRKRQGFFCRRSGTSVSMQRSLTGPGLLKSKIEYCCVEMQRITTAYCGEQSYRQNSANTPSFLPSRDGCRSLSRTDLSTPSARLSLLSCIDFGAFRSHTTHKAGNRIKLLYNIEAQLKQGRGGDLTKRE